MGSSSGLGGCALLVVALSAAAFWWFGDDFWHWDEVTVHYAWCHEDLDKNVCKGKEQAGGTITYKALVDQQTVVHWSRNGNVVERFEWCAVRNSSNWTCFDRKGDPLAAKHNMVDGVVQESALARLYVVPAWRWWLLHLEE